jgi:hypothetical protein
VETTELPWVFVLEAEKALSLALVMALLMALVMELALELELGRFPF